MRFVLMNDIHVEPDHHGAQPRHAAEGLARALESVQELSPAPEFIITGGDHVMDVLESSAESAKAQWDLFDATMAKHCRLPTYPMVGNHDIFGWMNSSISPHVDGYGKEMAQRRLKLECPYYSFDRGGWHFTIIDNIQRRGHGYCGAVDADQLAWIEEDLEANASKPTLVFTHIPIISAAATQFLDPSANVTFWQIPHVFVQTDSQPLVNLLVRFKVKAAISGHIHMCERVEYKGISFICNGSVCANWWRGSFKGFAGGYGLFDLRDTGTFDYSYKTF